MKFYQLVVFNILVLLFSVVSIGVFFIFDQHTSLKVMMGIFNICLWLIFLYVINFKLPQLKAKRIKYIASNIINSFLFLVLLVGVNKLFFHWQFEFDMSQKKLNSLNPKAQELVESLKGTYQLSLFSKKENWEQWSQLLKKYIRHKNEIDLKFYDPDVHLKEYEKFNIKKLPSLLIESPGYRHLILNPTQEKITESLYHSNFSQKFTICYGTHQKYFRFEESNLAGYSMIKDTLFQYHVNFTPLINVGNLNSCSAFLFANYISDISIDLFQKTWNHLKILRKPLILAFNHLEWEQIPQKIRDLLKAQGIKIEKNIIIDRQASKANLNLDHLVNKEYFHADHEAKPLVFPQASTIIYETTDKAFNFIQAPDYPRSWPESEVKKLYAENLSEYSQKDDISKSKMIYGLYPKSAQQRFPLAIIGTSRVFENRFTNVSSNSRLIKELVLELVNPEVLNLTPPQEIAQEFIHISELQIKTVFYLSIIALPLFMLGMALFVYFRFNI